VEFTDFSQSTAFQTLLAIDLSIQGFETPISFSRRACSPQGRLAAANKLAGLTRK
jgi:hypothetical protein